MFQNKLIAALVMGLALAACSNTDAEGLWANGETLDISLPELATDPNLNNRDYSLKCCGAGFPNCDSPDSGLDVASVDEVMFTEAFEVSVTPHRTSDYACRVEDASGNLVVTKFEVEGEPITLAKVADYTDGVAFRFRTCEPGSEGCNARGVIDLGDDSTAPTTPTDPTDVVSYVLAVSLADIALTTSVVDVLVDGKEALTELLLAGSEVTTVVQFAEGESQKQIRITLANAGNNDDLINNCSMHYSQKISARAVLAGVEPVEGNYCDDELDAVAYIMTRDGNLVGVGDRMIFLGLVGDDDNDGYVEPADCNDSNSSVYPGATEIDDNIDNDCDGTVDEGFGAVERDDDNDGYCEGTAACFDTSDLPGDCNDANSAIHPGAVEVTGDGIDNNCNGMGDENLVLKTNQVAVQFDLPTGVELYFWSGLDGTLEAVPGCASCGSVVKVVDNGVYALNLATPLIYNGKVSGAWCFEPNPRSQCQVSAMKVVTTNERWEMVQQPLVETQSDGGGHGNGTLSCTLNGATPTSCTLRSTVSNAVISKLP